VCSQLCLTSQLSPVILFLYSKFLRHSFTTWCKLIVHVGIVVQSASTSAQHSVGRSAVAIGRQHRDMMINMFVLLLVGTRQRRWRHLGNIKVYTHYRATVLPWWFDAVVCQRRPPTATQPHTVPLICEPPSSGPRD
jgi:hypothetical protein